MDSSFRKHERIRCQNDFKRVYAHGKKQVSFSFVLYIDEHDPKRQYRRLGITASKKVGNAVTRNRCKRLVRELFRRNKESFPPGADVIIIVKREMVGKRYAEIEEELGRIRHK